MVDLSSSLCGCLPGRVFLWVFSQLLWLSPGVFQGFSRPSKIPTPVASQLPPKVVEVLERREGPDTVRSVKNGLFHGVEANKKHRETKKMGFYLVNPRILWDFMFFVVLD